MMRGRLPVVGLADNTDGIIILDHRACPSRDNLKQFEGLRLKLKADVQGFRGMGKGTDRDNIDPGHSCRTDIG